MNRISAASALYSYSMTEKANIILYHYIAYTYPFHLLCAMLCYVMLRCVLIVVHTAQNDKMDNLSSTLMGCFMGSPIPHQTTVELIF